MDLFSGFGEVRRTPRATSRPLDHGRIHLMISSTPSSTSTVALPDTKWIGGGLILRRYQTPIVAWAVFDQRVDHFHGESTSSTACSSASKKIWKKKKKKVPVFSKTAVRELSSTDSFSKRFGNKTLRYRASIVIGRSVCVFLNVEYSATICFYSPLTDYSSQKNSVNVQLC